MTYEVSTGDKVIYETLPSGILNDIRQRNVVHMCGKRNGTTITYATLELITEKREAFLKYIYVAPAYRRLHYGLELLEETRDFLKTKGINLILTDIRADEDMIMMGDLFLEEADFIIEDADDGIRLWSYSF